MWALSRLIMPATEISMPSAEKSRTSSSTFRMEKSDKQLMCFWTKSTSHHSFTGSGAISFIPGVTSSRVTKSRSGSGHVDRSAIEDIQC